MALKIIIEISEATAKKVQQIRLQSHDMKYNETLKHTGATTTEAERRYK